MSPEFSGFVASASWGEDDFWDVALNYEGEFGGFKVAAGIGYGEITDNGQTQHRLQRFGAARRRTTPSCRQFGGSISVIHEKVGPVRQLRRRSKDRRAYRADRALCGAPAPTTSQFFWSTQAGIEKKFHRRLGKTTIYGEYYDYDGGGNAKRTVTASDALNPTCRHLGILWDTACRSTARASRRASTRPPWSSTCRTATSKATLRCGRFGAAGVASGTIRDAPIDDLDLVMSGAIIKF